MTAAAVLEETHHEVSRAELLDERAIRREAFQPRPRITLSEWADQHRVLDRAASAEPGQWHTTRFPPQRAIMDALSDPIVEEVVWMKSSQVGATEILVNFCGYVVDRDPGPLLIVEPTEKMAKALSTDRIAPMLKSTKVVRDKLVNAAGGRRESGDTMLYKQFSGGHLTLVTARSASDLASRPIRYVLLDEKNRYPRSTGKEGRADRLAIARSTNFWNRKLYHASTPTTDDAEGIEADFARTDQRYYFVPCPHCNEMQRLRWRDDDGTHRVVWDRTIDAKGGTHHKTETAVYVCAHCSAAIEELSKTWMLEHGEWRATNPEQTSSRVVGFHINALYSPWMTWTALAQEWVDTKGEVGALREFVNTRLGEVFVETTARYKTSELAMRCEPYGAEVPREVGVLTAAVDVQDDRLEVKVKGWGAGEESWLILHEVVVGDPGQQAVWDEVDQTYLTRAFRHEAGGALRIRATCVDSGGHHTDAVYKFCRKRKARRLFATKGHSMMHQPLWPLNPPKRPGRGGVRVWMVGTDTAKDIILSSRLKLVHPETSKPIGAGAMHFPEETPEAYFEGLTAEVKKPITIGGKRSWRWTRLSGRRNEPLDLEVLCLAGLRALGKSVYDHLDREVARVIAEGEKAAATPAAEAEPTELEPESFTKDRINARRSSLKRGRGRWLNNWRR